jgi:hypothetical protein
MLSRFYLHANLNLVLLSSDEAAKKPTWQLFMRWKVSAMQSVQTPEGIEINGDHHFQPRGQYYYLEIKLWDSF